MKLKFGLGWWATNLLQNVIKLISLILPS